MEESEGRGEEETWGARGSSRGEPQENETKSKRDEEGTRSRHRCCGIEEHGMLVKHSQKVTHRDWVNISGGCHINVVNDVAYPITASGTHQWTQRSALHTLWCGDAVNVHSGGLGFIFSFVDDEFLIGKSSISLMLTTLEINHPQSTTSLRLSFSLQGGLLPLG